MAARCSCCGCGISSLFFSFFVFFQATLASLNNEPINSLIYRIDILDKPVLNDQVQSGSVMSVMSKYGQRYRCSLPDIPNPKEDSKLTDEPGSQAHGSSLSDIGILLKPLETGPCLVKTKDWWTYEFCYGKHIKQYHLEDNKIVSPVIVLGVYHSEYDWKNKSKEDEMSRNRLQRYHSQYYLNGSKCEVTGILRKAEVRFLCEDGAGDYVSQVEEPESCRYVITVRTTRVCHHPYLRPPPTNTPHLIKCNPVLNSEQYELFRKLEEEDKELFEERRKAWLTKQEERLEELKELNEDQQHRKSKEEEVAKEEEKEEEDAATAAKDQSDIEEDTMDRAITAAKVSAMDPSTVNSDSDEESGSEGGEKGVAEQESQLLSVEKLVERLQVLGKVLEDKMEVEDQLASEDSDDPTTAAAAAREETFGKLVATLTQLLQQLDKAEQDLNNANEALWNLQNAIQNQEQGGKQAAAADAAIASPTEEDSKIDQSEEVVTQKAGLEMEPAISEDKDPKKLLQEARSSLRLKVNRLSPELKKALKAENNDDDDILGKDEEEDKLDNKGMSTIEKALREHLKQSGMDTMGKKVEVKIITSAYLDEDKDEFHFLNEDESSQLQTVLLKILAGNEEAAERAQHQKMLEKNYKFVWKDKNEATSGSFDDDDDEDEEED